MNLLEEYILRKGNIIILISGLSGSKRSLVAKEIEKDFKLLTLISLDNYCDSEKVKVIDFFENKVNDWDDIDVYDWDKFNKDIKHDKNYVIFGDAFPKDKLKFEPNFHMHITISKDKLIEKRKEYIDNNPDKCKDILAFIDKLNTFINKVTYSHYIKNRNESKIDLWLKSDENTLDEMYNQTFDYIINKMTLFLNEYYAKNINKVDFIKDNNTSKQKKVESESSSEVENKDELDKIYNEENKNNISLGKFADYYDELKYVT
jgi:uridine kinase